MNEALNLDGKRLWTAGEAAYYLHLSKETIQSRVQARTIPFIRVSRKCVRFRKTDLDAWLGGKACMPARKPAALAIMEGKNGTQGR